MKFLSDKKKRTKFTIVNVAVLAIFIILMIATRLIHYPPSPTISTKNIQCDFKPILTKPMGIAADSQGRFYLHTSDGTLCYDKDWNYVCTFATSQREFDVFYIENDFLCYQCGRTTVLYDLDGNLVKQILSQDKEMTEQITDEKSETYKILGGSLFPQVRKSDGEVVWRGSLFGTILKCALTLSVISNLLWLLIYAIETAGD